MKIERDAKHSDALPTLDEFRKACLNCSDCNGMCWQILEMLRLPDMIVGANRATA